MKTIAQRPGRKKWKYDIVRYYTYKMYNLNLRATAKIIKYIPIKPVKKK